MAIGTVRACAFSETTGQTRGREQKFFKGSLDNDLQEEVNNESDSRGMNGNWHREGVRVLKNDPATAWKRSLDLGAAQDRGFGLLRRSSSMRKHMRFT